MAKDDYSLVEDKAPWDDIVANYDDEQLIKDAEYCLEHIDEIPEGVSNRRLERSTLDYFEELYVKSRNKREEDEFKLVKRDLVSDVIYYQNYENNKDKYNNRYNREQDWRNKTGLNTKDDYYFTKSRRDDKPYFRGWKFHLDVNPTPEDEVTKEISEFLKTLDIEHKISHGGENGKGMTVYTGSYEDTRKVARLVYERFHDKMELPPVWNDNLMGEHFFNPLVCGRFLDGGHPFPTEYPYHIVSGIAGYPRLYDIPNGIGLKSTVEGYYSNAKKNGITVSDISFNFLGNANNADVATNRTLHTIASYTMHKLYTQEFGKYYHGSDLDKFEKTFSGERE